MTANGDYEAIRKELESAVPAANVQAVLDMADRYSSIRDVFRRAVPVRREIAIP